MLIISFFIEDMSGHSKWATIKRKKSVLDSRKGAVFTKLAKNIAVAAKGGKDPAMNPALRTAVESARQANMPKDNIEKAILKGAGEVPGAVYEEVLYEGYGPGGVAFIVECVTDNTNRSVSFVRSTFTKNNGSLGASGSVLYLFSQKGVIRIGRTDEDMGGKSVEDIEMLAIENDAEDIQVEDEGITIITPREGLHAMAEILQAAGVKTTTVALEWITPNMIEVEESVAEKCRHLIETLEEDDDVSAVHTSAVL